MTPLRAKMIRELELHRKLARASLLLCGRGEVLSTPKRKVQKLASRSKT